MNKKIPADATKVFDGVLFDVYQKEVQQFDNSYKTFERVRGCDVVKAICIVDNKIITEHDEQPGNRTKHTLPGGMIERGENPDECIRREIEEETGIVFGEIIPRKVIGNNVGLLESYRHYYIARNPISFGEQKLDEGGEKITVEYVDFDQMIEAIKKGEIFHTLGDWLLREYILTGKEDELKKILFG